MLQMLPTQRYLIKTESSTCTTRSKYYSYLYIVFFHADRNVRPCMIQGYTLTTFPKRQSRIIFMQKTQQPEIQKDIKYLHQLIEK